MVNESPLLATLLYFRRYLKNETFVQPVEPLPLNRQKTLVLTSVTISLLLAFLSKKKDWKKHREECKSKSAMTAGA